MVLNLAELDYNCRWNWFLRPRQVTGMPVEDYYNRFRVWKEEMINLSFPAEEADYIDGFIENLNWDIRFRVSKWSFGNRLTDAFYTAKYEESMIIIERNLQEIKAIRDVQQVEEQPVAEYENVIAVEDAKQLGEMQGDESMEDADELLEEMGDAHQLFDEIPKPVPTGTGLQFPYSLHLIAGNEGNDCPSTKIRGLDVHQLFEEKRQLIIYEKSSSLPKIAGLEIGHGVDLWIDGTMVFILDPGGYSCHRMSCDSISEIEAFSFDTEGNLTNFSSKSKFELDANLWDDEISMFVFDPGGNFWFYNGSYSFNNDDIVGVVSYTSLIDGYCKAGDMCVAHNLLDQMRERGVKPNSLTISILIRGTLLHNNRNVERARWLMEMLWEIMASTEDKQANNAAFSDLINCLCREGLFHEVFKIAEDMPQGNNVSEEFAFADIINSLCKHGRYNGGARIIYMMRKRGITTSLMSYNAIVHGLCLEGDWFRSFQLLTEGIGSGYTPSEYTFKLLVEGLCCEDDLYKAKEVVNIMLKNREAAGERTRIYNIYLRALCLTSNQTELLNVLVTMLQTQCQPDIITLNTIIKGLCRMRRVDEAIKVLKDMRMGLFCSPDAVTFTTLISGLLEVGKVDDALDFLQTVMHECGITPNVVTYNVVLRGLFNLKMTNKALEIFAAMESGGVIADCTTYSIIISGLCESNLIDEAKLFWDDVVWPSKMHDNFVYSSILKGLCLSGKFIEAWDFLYELADCGVTLNNVNYNIVIDAAYKLGLKKEAYQILGEMRKNGLNPDSVTWRILNKFHGNAGNHLADDIESNSDRVHDL